MRSKNVLMKGDCKKDTNDTGSADHDGKSAGKPWTERLT